MPIVVLATKMPMKRASLGLPKKIVSSPKKSRIALKTVKTFATTIER